VVETLPELKLHYRTLGTPKRNPAGQIINGVLLLQGNTGTGANWLRPSLADELFGSGQPLDATQYFIIMQDAIGRGGSSKPSVGLKGNFPHYRYHDSPKNPADDREARLRNVALPIGRLPLGEEGGVAELKACWLLGDVDVDRCSREDGGDRERKLSSQHSGSPSTRSSRLHFGGQRERTALRDVRCR
jgi:hypothetical protein